MRKTPREVPAPEVWSGSRVDVRAFGAVGDGATDDTAAINRALAALPPRGGVLFFPPGHYLTDTVEAPEFTTFLGHSAWGYSGDGGAWGVSRESGSGGAVLSPVRDDMVCLIDARGKRGTRFVGLTLHGRKKGRDMHGILSCHGGQEQNLVIDDCRIEYFSGSGFCTYHSWVWCVRHSILFCNGLDGIDALYSWDAWVLDNQLTANGRVGLAASGATTITGNRIEQNSRGGLAVNRDHADHVQVTGNLFCCNRGPAIDIPRGHARSIAITGNTFRGSGSQAEPESDRDCHVRFEGVRGLAFTGNVLGGCPYYGIVLSGLQDSVVAGNAIDEGASHELIRDKGGHRNSVIADNPGRLGPKW